MAAEQRKLLEQLMGETLMSTSKSSQLKITDPAACRSYICGSCPHDLFTNTKQDMGTCRQQHLPSLREQYQSASEEEKREWALEYDYSRDIHKHVNECDRRIDQAASRLEQTPDEIRQSNALLKQISDLTHTIEAGLLEVEILAQDAQAVNLAVQDFHKVRQAMAEKEEREKDHSVLMDNSGPSGHQKLQVCDVCGAYLSRLDNDRRLADHFFGKMHLGFATMRKEQERLQTVLKGRPPPPREAFHQRDDYGDRNGYGQGHGRRGDYGGGRRGGYGGRGGYGRY